MERFQQTQKPGDSSLRADVSKTLRHRERCVTLGDWEQSDKAETWRPGGSRGRGLRDIGRPKVSEKDRTLFYFKNISVLSLMKVIYVPFKAFGKSRTAQKKKTTLNCYFTLQTHILGHFLHYILLLVELTFHTQLGGLRQFI